MKCNQKRFGLQPETIQKYAAAILSMTKSKD